MTLEWLLAVAAFCVVTCFTPGPNNAMLMASGLNFGFGRTMPHLLGVSIGFAFMLLAVASGIAGIFQTLPQLYGGLKIASALYLLWLAWRIATAESHGEDEARQGRPMTFFEGAAFQWINPKAWVMTIGASATYVLAEAPIVTALAVTGVMLATGLASSATWALGGTLLRPLIGNPTLLRAVNIVLALVLVASLWPIARDWFV